MAVLDFVPSFFVEGAPPPLIASLRVPTHGVGPFDVRLVSDPSKEFIDWFFKDYVDVLPHLVLILDWSFFSPLQ